MTQPTLIDDAAFGAAIREAITEAHHALTANAVIHAFMEPTRPATPARVLQDRIHSVLIARLDKIVGLVNGIGAEAQS